MSPAKTLQTYLWQATLLTLVVGVAGSEVYFRLCPDNSVGGFAGILFFLLLTGIVMTGVTEGSRKKAPQRTAQVYLLAKSARMILAVIAMAAYCLSVPLEAKGFLMTAMAYYIIYLVYDSWFFSHYGRTANRKKKSNEHNETDA